MMVDFGLIQRVLLFEGILEDVSVTPELLSSLLEGHVRPILRSNPHPRLSVTTGRAMSRTAGGSLASQDQFQEQIWKEHLGLANLIAWCIRNVPVRTVFLSFFFFFAH